MLTASKGQDAILPRARLINRSGGPFDSKSAKYLLEAASQEAVSGYLRCATGKRLGDARLCPSQMPLDVQPTPHVMGSPTARQPLRRRSIVCRSSTTTLRFLPKLGLIIQHHRKWRACGRVFTVESSKKHILDFLVNLILMARLSSLAVKDKSQTSHCPECGS